MPRLPFILSVVIIFAFRFTLTIIMKKIGILFGKENSFPPAFVERVNSKGIKGVEAEFVKVEELIQGKPSILQGIPEKCSVDRHRCDQQSFLVERG